MALVVDASDDDENDDSEKMGNPFGDVDRSCSYTNDDKSKFNSDHDYEIGYYMNLNDETNPTLELRSKGRVI